VFIDRGRDPVRFAPGKRSVPLCLSVSVVLEHIPTASFPAAPFKIEYEFEYDDGNNRE
jgi:hypothetical protein